MNFHFESLEQMDRANPALPGVAEQIPAYRAACEELKRSIDVFSSSELSAESTRLDLLRDRAYSALKAFLKVCLNDDDEAKFEAAERILAILRNTEQELGHPLHVGLAKESVILTSLLRNLEPCSEDFERIGATGRLKRLEDANQAYVDLQFERYLEKSNKPSGDVKAARAVADAAYRAIIDRINAQILLNGDEAFAPYVKLQNTLIENCKHLLAQRRGRAGKKDAEQTETK
ncbi:MAG: DUF6261 family protein [Tannerella sp.]|nr:DUF6261 family protein [Tannerella sp.]